MTSATYSFGYGGSATYSFGYGGGAIEFVVPAVCQCGCQSPDNVVVPRELLREAIRVSHPDLHAEGRKERATRVTQGLTSALAPRR